LRLRQGQAASPNENAGALRKRLTPQEVDCK
jgi:hypothetical protein